MRFIADFLESWIKIQLFRPLRNYQITYFKSWRLPSDLYRSEIQLASQPDGQLFDGMAEGRSGSESRLRALAEAYEKSCVYHYEQRTGRKTNRTLPYGIGVAFRRSRARRRALAEYWERQEFCTGNAQGEASLSRATPYGPICIHRLVTAQGIEGTGYGLTPAEAELSARKSLTRKLDFSLAPPRFQSPNRPPLSERLTPETNGWLECYYVGFFNGSDELPKS